MNSANWTSARTRHLAATLALLALAAALPADAQTFVAATECGKAGEAFVSETLSGSLAREGRNESLHLLNPAFFGRTAMRILASASGTSNIAAWERATPL
jgi:hypothetical protein